jgi:hypothetical protein
MTPIIFGSLVLFSDRQLTDLYSPYFDDLEVRTGSHLNHKNKGLWFEASNLDDADLYLPQRYKRMTVLTTNHKDQLLTELSNLDSEWGDARQLYKLNKVLEVFDPPMTAVVNNMSTSTGDSNGSIYLLALQEPLYINLIFDLEEHSVRLTWSTFDFKRDLQERKHFRYIHYALPTLINRPLFIHTRRICGQWWNFRRMFGETMLGLLRACNALELVLYKDPALPHL